jgi:hypothetical protein
MVSFVQIITALMMRTEMVLETSVSFMHLTQLISREDFIEIDYFLSEMNVRAYNAWHIILAATRDSLFLCR